MHKRHQLILLAVLAAGLAVFFYFRWQAVKPPGPFLGEAKARGDRIHVRIFGDLVVSGVYEMPPGSTLAALLDRASFTGDANALPVVLRDFPLLDGSLFEVQRREDGEVVIRRGVMSGQMMTLFFTPIDLNRAAAKDLEALPGIGAKTAEAIVQYRDEHGPFHDIDELAQVRGIGVKTIESIRDQLYVDETTKPPAAGEADRSGQ